MNAKRYVAIVITLGVTACSNDMSAKPGTRAYALNHGLRGDQVDEYMRVYRASRKGDDNLFQTGEDREEMARRDKAAEGFGASTDTSLDDLHKWNTSKPKRRDPSQIKVDMSDFLDWLNPFNYNSR